DPAMDRLPPAELPEVVLAIGRVLGEEVCPVGPVVRRGRLAGRVAEVLGGLFELLTAKASHGFLPGGLAGRGFYTVRGGSVSGLLRAGGRESGGRSPGRRVPVPPRGARLASGALARRSRHRRPCRAPGRSRARRGSTRRPPRAAGSPGLRPRRR